MVRSHDLQKIHRDSKGSDQTAQIAVLIFICRSCRTIGFIFTHSIIFLKIRFRVKNVVNRSYDKAIIALFINSATEDDSANIVFKVCKNLNN